MEMEAGDRRGCTLSTQLRKRGQEGSNLATMGKTPCEDKGLINFCCSVADSCLTLCDPLDSSMPGFPVLHHLPELKFRSLESVMPSNHLILCHPLLLLHSTFPRIRIFSNELALRITWLKYWSFSLIISPPNEYSGLISFRVDWFDLLAVQGTLKSLLQHHSSKASILWHSCFPMVHLSRLYMTTGKTHSFDYTDLYQQNNVSGF